MATIEEMKKLYEMHEAFQKHDDDSICCCGKIAPIPMGFEWTERGIVYMRKKLRQIYGLSQELFGYLLSINKHNHLTIVKIFGKEIRKFKNFAQYEKYFNYRKALMELLKYLPLHKIGFVADIKEEYIDEFEQFLFGRKNPKEIEFYIEQAKVKNHKLIFAINTIEAFKFVAKNYNEIIVPYDENIFNDLCRVIETLLFYNPNIRFAYNWTYKQKEKFIEYLLNNNKSFLFYYLFR